MLFTYTLALDINPYIRRGANIFIIIPLYLVITNPLSVYYFIRKNSRMEILTAGIEEIKKCLILFILAARGYYYYGATLALAISYLCVFLFRNLVSNLEVAFCKFLF